MNNSLGTVITRCGFGTEDESDRGQITELSALQLIIDSQNAQGVHELALVFMETFDLNVENHIGIQRNSFPGQNLSTELLLLGFLYSTEFTAERFVYFRDKRLQFIQIRFKTGTDLIGNQFGKLRVAQAEPAALCDSVGFVLEPFRVKLIPVSKDIVFQNFTVQRSHAVGSMGGIDCKFRHVNPSVQDDAQRRGDFPAGFFHFTAETRVDLPDDGYDLRADRRQKAQVPFFQGFLHDRMVCIGKGVAGDEEGLLKGDAVLTQEADQLRNGHRGMRIVQLGGHFFGEEGIITSVTFPVCPQDILHRRGNQHILLFDTKLFSLFFSVVGIQELGDVLRLIFTGGSLCVILAVENRKVNFFQAFGLPQAQGTDILSPEPHHRHIIGNCQNVSCFHGNNHSFIETAD